MDDVKKLLLSTVWLSLGIAPLDGAVHLDINRILASLSPEEARKMRRKFRKMWRRYAKHDMKASKGRKAGVIAMYGMQQHHDAADVVLGPSPPSRRQKINRKRRVAGGIIQEFVFGDALRKNSESKV